MAVILLRLSLFVVTVIQLTSSQPTYDVIQKENDVNSCGRIEQMLGQLQATVSQLVTANSQLQRDVAELKAAVGDRTVNGELNGDDT